MNGSSTGTDALIEILSLCEQALTELGPDAETAPRIIRADNSRHFRRYRRAKIANRLLLIPGGLSTAARRVTYR